MRIITYLIFMAVLGLGLVVTGLGQVALQQRMLSHCQAEPARVINSQVKPVIPGGYQVAMVYEYVHGNNRYRATRVTPIGVLGSRAWAEDLVKRHGADTPVTVYVDPHDPGISFVWPIMSFLPYGLILLGTAILILSVLPLRAGGVFNAPPHLVPDGRSSWFTITSNSSPERRALFFLLFAGAWLAIGAFAGVHYFMQGPFNTLAAASLTLYGIIGLFFLVKGLRCLKSTGHIRTIHVWTAQKDLPVCAPIVVKMEIALARSTPIASARTALVCNRYSGFNREQLLHVSSAITERIKPAKGQVLQADHTFEIPTNKQRASTSPYAHIQFPRIDWLIEIEITFEKGPTCIYQFPVKTIPDRRKTKR